MDKIILESIDILLKHYKKPYEFVPGISPIKLMEPTFEVEEIAEVVESLLSTKVTMGEKVARFENDFARYIGTKHAIMVNSGSSANLLLLSALRDTRPEPKEEIITPAVTWSTTVFPIYQTGCIPHFVDVDPETLTPYIEQMEKAINAKTEAIMHVHLLGAPSDMERLSRIADENDLNLIEDSCEAHGASWNGKKVGSFGLASTFSFFFSHHISTIEGGMILTSNDELADKIRSKRAHGWIRERKDRDLISSKYPSIDPRFLFITEGYNVRPTELQGAIGIHQLRKLDKFLAIRKQNAEFWNTVLNKYNRFVYVPRAISNAEHAWFGYPIILKQNSQINRNNLVSFLEENKIETRPIMAGNITKQPALASLSYNQTSGLENAQLIDRNGVFIGNHSGIGEKERQYVADVLGRFFDKWV